MLNKLIQFIQNPMAALMKTRLNIPQDAQIQTPNDMIQYLLDSGQLTQDQYNRVNQTARQIENNPQIKQMLGIK